jgi:hypothetical protein
MILSKKYNIIPVKATKKSNFLLKKDNQLLKNYTFNKKCTNLILTYFLKLLRLYIWTFREKGERGRHINIGCIASHVFSFLFLDFSNIHIIFKLCYFF